MTTAVDFKNIITFRKAPETWAELPQLSRAWFGDALGHDDPRPTEESLTIFCDALRKEIGRSDFGEYLRVYRNNNGRPPPIRSWVGEPDLEVFEADSLASYREAAGIIVHGIGALRKARPFVEEFWGEQPPSFRGGVTLGEVEQKAFELMNLLIAIGAKNELPQKSDGRPREHWHKLGRRVVPLVERVAQESGFQARSCQSPESVTARVGAAACGWAYEKPITPDAFATAMRGRRRASKAE